MLAFLLIRNMKPSLRITILLRETEVNHIQYRFGRITGRHDKVGRFNVTVDEPSRVNVFDARKLRVSVLEWKRR
jgi:hypothetical protein